MKGSRCRQAWRAWSSPARCSWVVVVGGHGCPASGRQQPGGFRHKHLSILWSAEPERCLEAIVLPIVRTGPARCDLRTAPGFGVVAESAEHVKYGLILRVNRGAEMAGVVVGRHPAPQGRSTSRPHEITRCRRGQRLAVGFWRSDRRPSISASSWMETPSSHMASARAGSQGVAVARPASGCRGVPRCLACSTASR
jgi:hypothetical protein